MDYSLAQSFLSFFMDYALGAQSAFGEKQSSDFAKTKKKMAHAFSESQNMKLCASISVFP